MQVKNAAPIEIPKDVLISQNCEDLLTRCLQRDRNSRIDYDDFFAHPFIDLEHAPSAESEAKAVQLARQAVEKDNARDFEAALDLYKASLEYFVPLMQEENVTSKKQALREKVISYIQRAEQLKSSTASLTPSTSASRCPSPPATLKLVNHNLQKRSISLLETKSDELLDLSKSHPKMKTGVEIAKAAEEYEMEGRLQLALNKYQTSLGILMELFKQEPSGNRKKLLGEEIKRWMSRAERLKTLLSEQEEMLAKYVGQDPTNSHCILS